MQTFTGKEYVKIAIANAFGLDKLLFRERIEWVDNQTMDELFGNVENADEPAIYYAGLLALQDAEAGVPSGFMVGLDACSSGLQIMGALMGCVDTCAATGLIDPNRRADAYTDTTAVMNGILAQSGISGVQIERKPVKQAVMTHFYGSTMQPKTLFGEGTPEIDAFYDALEECFPGACVAMQALLNTWQPYKDLHEWVMPDGFHVKCPVIVDKEVRVRVAELDDASFTHLVYVNEGTETGLSNAANIVHSIDGMLCREMQRRANYEPTVLKRVKSWIKKYLANNTVTPDPTKFTSMRLVEQLNDCEVTLAEVESHLPQLLKMIDECLEHKPFPIITVHDEFKCHPNNMNQLRKNYIRIFKQLADCNLLEDIISQITGALVPSMKMGNISHMIAKSNYGLS